LDSASWSRELRSAERFDERQRGRNVHHVAFDLDRYHGFAFNVGTEHDSEQRHERLDLHDDGSGRELDQR
jgi:hypothetical protein